MSRWISVKSRNPPANRYVLVTGPYNEPVSTDKEPPLMEVMPGYLCSTGWKMEPFGIDHGLWKVTHWMAIPEPPKEGN